MHRRGSNIPSYRHKLVDYGPHGLLIFNHLTKLALGREPVPFDAGSNTAHDIALHRPTLALGLHQQHRIHKGPNLPMLPET